jgi:hypothetical protein
MRINPKDYTVSADLLRQRLGLKKEITIVPFGYEGILDKAVLSILKTRFDSASLFIRTRPDFFVIEENELYFVEAKQKTKNIEAIQLLYNKQCERMGIKVLYSFPEITIRATQIPMDVIVIPENYKKEFDNNLKHLFENEGIKEFRYVNHVKDGSGDAFVPVEINDLSILAEELTQ